jgi:hypothetical protein
MLELQLAQELQQFHEERTLPLRLPRLHEVLETGAWSQQMPLSLTGQPALCKHNCQ